MAQQDAEGSKAPYQEANELNHSKPIAELSDLSGIDLASAADAVMRRRQRDIEVLRERNEIAHPSTVIENQRHILDVIDQQLGEASDDDHLQQQQKIRRRVEIETAKVIARRGRD